MASLYSKSHICNGKKASFLDDDAPFPRGFPQSSTITCLSGLEVSLTGENNPDKMIIFHEPSALSTPFRHPLKHVRLSYQGSSLAQNAPHGMHYPEI